MRTAVSWICGAAIALGAAMPAGAQVKLPLDANWTLEGASGGYCIWYLADPAIARKMVPGSVVLTPAGNGAGLPPLLASTVREEPRFAQWIPGSICIAFYQRVMSDGRIIASGRPDRPIIIATSALAAQNAHDVEGANEYLLELTSDNRNLISAADRIGVDITTLTYLSRVRVEGSDPSVTITLAGAVIGWSGHAVADSSVGTTHSVSFGYGGPKSANWLVTQQTAPTSFRLMSGSLSVEGRDNLAKALLASPARAIGPLTSGGTASLSFHAVTKR